MAGFNKIVDKSTNTNGIDESIQDALRALSAMSSATSAPPSSTVTSGGVQTPAAQTASFRYIDRPELAETFADSITALFFDGQSLRIEFGVSRVDDIKPNTPISGRRYPACRLVLPPGAAVELINKIQQIGAALTKAGVVKQSEPTKDMARQSSEMQRPAQTEQARYEVRHLERHPLTPLRVRPLKGG